MADAKMTVRGLASAVGVDDKTVARWLSYERIPHPRHRWAAAEALSRWPEVLSVTCGCDQGVGSGGPRRVCIWVSSPQHTRRGHPQYAPGAGVCQPDQLSVRPARWCPARTVAGSDPSGDGAAVGQGYEPDRDRRTAGLPPTHRTTLDQPPRHRRHRW